ncbi:MAG: hypothetical protein KKH83_06560, partial [Candidatus Margulisbacteria bacterium]|nr:hypothetical protein [Candidatus Margulisiibacteriota bacterium]
MAKIKKIDTDRIKKMLQGKINFDKRSYTDQFSLQTTEFWNQVFVDGERRGREYFDWYYRNNPAGLAEMYVALS